MVKALQMCRFVPTLWDDADINKKDFLQWCKGITIEDVNSWDIETKFKPFMKEIRDQFVSNGKQLRVMINPEVKEWIDKFFHRYASAILLLAYIEYKK